MTVILKKILFWVPFVQLFCLLLLTFYQHPVADDFAGSYLAAKMGIGGAIRSYLVNGTGRYFVVSFFVLVCSSRFLLDHYFIIPVLFFFATYVNIFYLLREIWKFIFERQPVLRHLLWLAAAGLVLFLNCMEQVSTFFIWLTTCCIFLLSFNLLVFYTRWLMRFGFDTATKKPAWLYSLLVLTILLLCGCEETTVYFSLLLNICFWYAKRKEGIRGFALFLVILQTACIAMVFLMPGNRMRTHNFSTVSPIYSSMFSAFYQTIYIAFKIFSTPLFWLAGGTGIALFPFLNEVARKRVAAADRSYLIYLAAIALCTFSFFLFIRHFGDRVVPEYANNLIICYVIIILLALVISKSYWFRNLAGHAADTFKQNKGIVYPACIFIFIFSGFMQGMIQSLVTAPVHDTVLTDRKIKIAEAKAAGKTSVQFDDYQDACMTVLQRKYGIKTALFVKNLFHFPPQYIYTRNPAQVDFGYAAYYGMDTIYAGTKRIVSWDKAGIPLWNVK